MVEVPRGVKEVEVEVKVEVVGGGGPKSRGERRCAGSLPVFPVRLGGVIWFRTGSFVTTRKKRGRTLHDGAA